MDLLLAAATLFWAALTDFRNFKICNEAVMVLAGLYFLFALVSGSWTSVPWNVGFAALMLAAMLYGYSVQKVGGGDLKLLTVAFLWTGPRLLGPFAILLLIFVGVHYLAARFGFAAAEQTPAGLKDSAGSVGGGSADRHVRIGPRQRDLSRGANRVFPPLGAAAPPAVNARSSG